MTPGPAGNTSATVSLRLTGLEEAKREHDKRIDVAEKVVDKHELALYGERGVYAALSDINRKLSWINTGLWAIALAIIGAAVGIVFGG